MITLLFKFADGVKSGAWSARTLDQDQFIQADLRQLHEVSGVMTQGRNVQYSQWVTSFRVLYSIDGLTWTAVQNAIMAGSKVSYRWKHMKSVFRHLATPPPPRSSSRKDRKDRGREREGVMKIECEKKILPDPSFDELKRCYLQQ